MTLLLANSFFNRLNWFFGFFALKREFFLKVFKHLNRLFQLVKLIYSLRTALLSKYIQTKINCLSTPNKFIEYQQFYKLFIEIVYQFESIGNPVISLKISNSILWVSNMLCKLKFIEIKSSTINILYCCN